MSKQFQVQFNFTDSNTIWYTRFMSQDVLDKFVNDITSVLANDAQCLGFPTPEPENHMILIPREKLATAVILIVESE